MKGCSIKYSVKNRCSQPWLHLKIMGTCWKTLMSEPYPWPLKMGDQFRNSPEGGGTARCAWTAMHDEVGNVKDEVWEPTFTNYALTGPGRQYEWVKHAGEQGSRRIPGFSKPQWIGVEGHWQSELLWGTFFFFFSVQPTLLWGSNQTGLRSIACGLWAASLLFVVWGQDGNSPSASRSVFWHRPGLNVTYNVVRVTWMWSIISVLGSSLGRAAWLATIQSRKLKMLVESQAFGRGDKC